MKKLVLIGLVVSLIWIVGTRIHSPAQKEDSEQSQIAPPPPPAPADVTQLEATVNQLIAANRSVQISVSITDLATANTYHYGEPAGFKAASTSKLITAIYTLHQVNSGQLALEDTIDSIKVQDLLEKLITVSDNQAWQSLNTEFGKPTLQQYAHQLGLNSYNSQENIITGKDMNTLVSKLYQHQLLSENLTDLLLSYMKRADSRQYIMAAVPSDLTAYHKAGYLDDRAHDTAIITNGTRAFVLTIFTKQTPYNFETGTKIIHSVTRAGIDAFLTRPR